MEWKTGLPEKSGDYVVFFKYRSINTISFSERYKAFNAYDSQEERIAMRNNLNSSVLKWVPLAEFLKEQGLANEKTN